jgi:hypothetical protein
LPCRHRRFESLHIITSLVYLGKNIEEEDGEADLWFFQDSESYITYEHYKETKQDDLNDSNSNNTVTRVIYFSEESLKEILTLALLRLDPLIRLHK